jgi:hypothetical protein
MRTTLTIEDDVAIRLEKLRVERDQSFKATVNEVLRRGLDAVEAPVREREPYRMKTHSGGKCYLPSLDNTAEVLAWAEGEAYK